MVFKFQYSNQAEREKILSDNKNNFVVEEQFLFEGNFLIFTDIKPLENQVQELKDNQLTLMSAIADLYETIATV